jgi:predicted nucleic acid-binding protein
VKSVFVDSSGFFALLVHEDQFHEHAYALFQQANTERWRLVTTNVVVIEAYALFLIRSQGGRRDAIRFLDMIAADKYRIERIRKADEERAIALVHAHEDKTYSLCDALSFIVMERLHIREAIAFDRHFRSYGRFTILE